MLRISEDVAFGVRTVLGDSSLFIPLPCLSGTCVLHNTLKNNKSDAAWGKKKKNPKPEKEQFDQVNLI